MSTNGTNQDLQKIVENFIVQLNEHFRAEVIATLSAGKPITVSNGGNGKANGGHVNGGGNGNSKSRNGKRSQEEINMLAEKFLNFVVDNPGVRVEIANKVLGTTTKDLQLPIKQLLDEKRVKTRGQRRATAYTAVDK